MDAILEHAGAARRSLYQHFGGKDRLLAEALHETAEDDLARYRAAQVAPDGADGEIQRVLADCDRRLAGHRAALEASADPTVVAAWMAEIQARRATALAQTRRDKAKVYQRLNLRLTYQPAAHKRPGRG